MCEMHYHLASNCRSNPEIKCVTLDEEDDSIFVDKIKHDVNSILSDEFQETLSIISVA